MKEKLSEEYIIEGWLKKYHGLTIAELVKNEPELVKSHLWFKKYAVSQEEHDEWYQWAIKELCKSTGMSKKMVERSFAFNYLNVAPDIK